MKIDIGTVAGLACAFGLILLGNHLEGGHMSAIVQPTAALIVFGGTLGAVMVGFSMEDFIRAMKAITLFFGNKTTDRRLVSLIPWCVCFLMIGCCWH